MYCPLCAASVEPGRARCPVCQAPLQQQPPFPAAPDPTARPDGAARVEWTPPPPMAPPDPRFAVIASQPPPSGPGTGAAGRPGGPGAPTAGWAGGGPGTGPAADSTALPPAGRGQRGAWRAAAECVGLSVAAVYLAGLCLSLLYAAAAGDLPGRALLRVPAAGVATSFGASWAISLDSRDIGDLFGAGGAVTYDVRAHPLLLSVLGVLMLAWLVRRRFAAGICAGTLADRLSQAARVGLLLGAAGLVFAVLSRLSFGGGHLNAQYPLAFIAGTVTGAVVVALVALWQYPVQAPPGVRRLAAELAEPLVALRFVLPTIVLLGVLQLLGVLIFGRVDDDLTALGLDNTTSRSLGIALLLPYAPNVSWMLFGIVLGAPFTVHTGIGIGGERRTSLLDLAHSSAWWWLAPVAVFAVLFGAGLLLALRSPNAQVARHRVGVWALTLGGASLVLGYLGAVTVHLRGPLGDLHGSVGNDPMLVLVLSCAWALLSGLGAVALVARLGPATRARWAAAVRSAPDPSTAGRDTDDPGPTWPAGPTGPAGPAVGGEPAG